MEMDYNLLAKNIAGELLRLIDERVNKKLVGRKYWASLRKQKNELKENVIPVESAYNPHTNGHKNCDSCEIAKILSREIN